MTVIYRIQAADGRGPYRENFSHKWVDYDHPIFPALVQDFGDSIVEDLARYMHRHGGHFGCGFKNMTQLRRWFSDKEISALVGFNYTIVEMPVDRILYRSRYQRVFWRREPLTVNFKPWSVLCGN